MTQHPSVPASLRQQRLNLLGPATVAHVVYLRLAGTIGRAEAADRGASCPVAAAGAVQQATRHAPAKIWVVVAASPHVCR